MPQEQPGQENSDMWISLDEAEKRSGMSKRNLLDWTKEGKVKREKKKGVIYLWVADLIKLAPLTQTEISPVETEILSPVPEPSTSIGNFGPLRNISDQIETSLDNQNSIIQNFEALQKHIQKISKASNKPVLDEKTVKELSLLGNVFKSLYQQNEKLNQTLSEHGKTLTQISGSEQSMDILNEKIATSEKSRLVAHLCWAAFSIFAVAILMIFIVYFKNNVDTLNLSLNDVKSQSAEQLKDSKSQLEITKADRDRKLEQLRTESSNNMEKLRLAHKNNVEKTSLRLTEEKKEIKHEYEKMTTKIDQNHQLELGRIELAKKEEIGKLTQQYLKELEKLKKANQEQAKEHAKEKEALNVNLLQNTKILREIQVKINYTTPSL